MAKITKNAASYKVTAANNHCRDCTMYSPGQCSLVVGPIKPGGTCRYFEADRKAAKK